MFTKILKPEIMRTLLPEGFPADKLSQPRYEMVTETDVFVTMRDGVRVAVDIFRPDGPGEFPVIYAIGLAGKAGFTPNTLQNDLTPLFETILKEIPAPAIEPDAPARLLVTTLDYDDYKGQIGVGRLAWRSSQRRGWGLASRCSRKPRRVGGGTSGGGSSSGGCGRRRRGSRPPPCRGPSGSSRRPWRA